MKEIIIKSITDKDCELEIVAQLFDGKIVMINDKNRTLKDKKEDDEDDWYSDNDAYIYAVWRVLKAVDKAGGFDHLKPEDEEDAEVIYV